MFPKFLRWLPKYRLSTPTKRSFQTWCMVVDNLAANDVSFFVVVVVVVVFGDFVFIVVLFGFFLFWVLCDFQMSLTPWLRCEEHVECEWAQELNGRQVCLSVAMGDIGILVTRYWLRFNMCTLLRRFLPFLVLPSGWQTF